MASVVHSIINTVKFDRERDAKNWIFSYQKHLKDEEVNSIYELALEHINRKIKFDELVEKLKSLSVKVELPAYK